MMRRSLVTPLLAALAVMAPAAAQAEVRITEFMYQGAANGNREFWELTNIGLAAVDTTGWSYNDNNPDDVGVPFGTLVGLLGANETIVFTELAADTFRAQWAVPLSIRIFSYGGNSNLNATDTINIYNSTVQNATTLVDTRGVAGSSAVSLNRPNAGGAAPSGSLTYVASAVGDAYGSKLSTLGDLGNPGFYLSAAAVPEPSTWAMMIGGFAIAGGALRRRRRTAAFA